MKRRCKVEVFSRVTGFFRPVQEWNKGKQEEFKDRKTFKVKEAIGASHSRNTETVVG